MTTPENVIECTTEIEDNTDKQNEKKKYKRQVNKHQLIKTSVKEKNNHKKLKIKQKKNNTG